MTDKGRVSIPRVTICVLTYGPHCDLVSRCIQSILKHCPRNHFDLVVGANAVCADTLDYLDLLSKRGTIDHLIVSDANINKCPMMRLLFERVRTEFIWWFDDDSHLRDDGVMKSFLRAALAATPQEVMWGRAAVLDFGPPLGRSDRWAVEFVRTALWYRGLTPPSYRIGGKGEFDYKGNNTGDPHWRFILGGSWWIRTSAIRGLDWPDTRLIKGYDDVILGEAIRQQGWMINNRRPSGLVIDDAERRGDSGYLPSD